jgi:hypothetical protein
MSQEVQIYVNVGNTGAHFVVLNWNLPIGPPGGNHVYPLSLPYSMEAEETD